MAANHGMFTRDRQVSIRASAKPGRGGVGLRGCDFKCSKHVYAMISRQSPDVIWLEVLKPSDPAVKAFARRNKLGYPDQRYLDHGDTFDAFLMELDLDRTRKEGGFFQSSVVPKKKEEVGSVYPSLLELEDIHTWVLESTRCRLTLCSAERRRQRCDQLCLSREPLQSFHAPLFCVVLPLLRSLCIELRGKRGNRRLEDGILQSLLLVLTVSEPRCAAAVGCLIV